MLHTSVAVLMSAFTMTGALSPAKNHDVTDYLRIRLMLSLYPATEPVAREASAAEIISRLKNAGLPLLALADAMRVERKSIYNWLDGENIQEHNLRRLKTLDALLPRDEGGLKILYRLFRRPLADGTTLRSLLAEQNLDEGAIRQAIEHLWPIAENYQAQEARRPVTAGTRVNPILDETPEAIVSHGRRTL